MPKIIFILHHIRALWSSRMCIILFTHFLKTVLFDKYDLTLTGLGVRPSEWKQGHLPQNLNWEFYTDPEQACKRTNHVYQ